MTHPKLTRLAPLALLAAAWCGSAVAADKPRADPAVQPLAPLPKPAEVQSLTAQPGKITLKGRDDAWQLVVTAAVGNRRQDLTGDVQYTVADPKVARVTSTGRVIPLANGSTEVTASYGDKSVKVSIIAESCDVELPINFANQIVPIFSKLGCNAGGCHGKASGQGGFKLSLLGAEPELDYNALVKEARGRRVYLAAPEHSLLLLKASGTIAHGGGKRTDLDSDEYKLLRRWVASGTPYGSPSDPVVTRITALPEHTVLSRQNKQQITVYAHYSDGSVEDVTRRAQYDSNDTEIAVVDSNGLVRTLALSGQAAIMARHLGQVTVFRATVPLGVPVPSYSFQPRTLVDAYTQKKWQELGIVPSELCNDEQFLRRAYLDLTGTLPTPEQVQAFLADNDPARRDKLIDHLLQTDEFTYYFANKWADILRVKRGNQQNRAYGTFTFHNWIREAMAADKPYDEFVRDILGAVGDETKNPPVVWYKDVQTPDQFVDNTAQVFLGIRLQCAQCHHHPYEKFSQDDYWGIAAYFGKLGRKALPVAGQAGQNQQQQRQVLFHNPKLNNTVINKRTNKSAVMKPLDGEPVNAGADLDPRQQLA